MNSAAPATAATMLFDFGGPESPSGGAATGPTRHWNNVTASTGASEFGEVPNLVDEAGEPTDVGFLMVSRFNGANESGTTASGRYPGSATRDSLFGNTEEFSGLSEIFPAFKLYGLNPASTYRLEFYASRLGVSDNRETRYTVTGATTATADLDAGNNVTNSVALSGFRPDGGGEITVEIAPGPNNNNANHFTYLGILGIEASTGERWLIDFGAGGTPTDLEEPTPGLAWNNVLTAVGANPVGQLTALVTTNGTATGRALQMIARFNGANLNGTTASTVFPASATQDSLFGNTEAFSGLPDVFPIFKLTGLEVNAEYRLTFYGSRTGVSDNRETRYTVRGASEAFADLNAANNVDATASLAGIRPDAAGEIEIRLSPGPNNNNGNHFTYLGVMQVDDTPILPPGFLIDFGAAGTPTAPTGVDEQGRTWNNVDATLGGNSAGVLPALRQTDGTTTGAALEMISRFNGANENGTTTTGPYPAPATRDSLFANTAEFGGLSDVTPIFKLTGLDPATAYDLGFYASRMGVGDNRETRYTVKGAAEATADLDVANNETEVARVTGVRPDAAGEIRIELEPGPNNSNGNLFIYLGVLEVSWTAAPPPQPAVLDQPSYSGGTFRFRLTGKATAVYRIQGSNNLLQWSEVTTSPAGAESRQIEVPAPAALQFYRAIE